MKWFDSPSIAIGSIAVVAIAVFVVMTLTGLRKPGQAVFQLARMMQFALEAPVRLLLRPTIGLLHSIPVWGRVVKWFWSTFTDDAVADVFNRVFRNSANPLVRGDLETVAKQWYPPERYPHLWMAVPDDLRRPLVVDGRLPDGARPASLAPKFIDSALVGSAFRLGVLSGVFWAVIALTFWHPQSIIGSQLVPSVSRGDQDQMVGNGGAGGPGGGIGAQAGVGMLALVREDVWNPSDLAGKIEAAARMHEEVIANRREAVLDAAPNGWITSILFGVLVALGTWRGLIRKAVQPMVDPLRRPTKESVVRWKYRCEQRDLEYQAYVGQLRVLAEFDRSAVVTLGTASGLFRYRGHLNGPMRGQALCVSLNDLAQHMLVLGGTGEGKTRSILLPMVDQLLALRQQDTENQLAISFYCTDGKGVLWRDIKGAAEKAGQGNDVRVMGCRVENGEYGVDLLDGVEPQLVADIIRSVARQTGGGTSSDSFWPDMASEVIRNCAVICRAWEMTDDGLAYVEQTGERIYSLVLIYQMTFDPALQGRAIKAIGDAYEDPHQRAGIKPFLTAELSYASRYMAEQWTTMAADTKTGILANITQVMSPFATNVALRRSFASGQAERVMSIAQAWGSICLVNVPSLEYGLAGRIVNVFLKTLLYTEARKREMADPKVGFREKMLFVSDEFQDLITADVAGLSDANFWNVARSTGMIGIISTQGMSSLEQAIGKVGSENFALQMRSKIILRVEDPSTLQYARTLAGKTLRSYTFESQHYESFEALVTEQRGVDPLSREPARINEMQDDLIKTLAGGWLQVPFASLPVAFETWAPNVDVDTRFIPRASLLGSGGGDEQRAAQQAAHWRAEDKNLAYMSDGNHESDVLREEDLVAMGRAHAFMYLQRAGGTRMDLVRIG